MTELAIQIREKLCDESSLVVLTHEEADFMRAAVRQALPVENEEENK